MAGTYAALRSKACELCCSFVGIRVRRGAGGGETCKKGDGEGEESLHCCGWDVRFRKVDINGLV